MTNEYRIYRYDNCKKPSKGKEVVLTDATSRVITFHNIVSNAPTDVKALYEVPAEVAESQIRLIVPSRTFPLEPIAMIQPGKYFRIDYVHTPSNLTPQDYGIPSDNVYYRVHAVKTITEEAFEQLKKASLEKVKQWSAQYKAKTKLINAQIAATEKLLKTQNAQKDKIGQAHNKEYPTLEDLL